MIMRPIVHIEEEKCDGCGQCVPHCHEGAIRIVGGKARLVADALCDGLGACLGPCPQGAITIVHREAEAFDEDAVSQRRATASSASSTLPMMSPPQGCPGSAVTPLRSASRPLPILSEHAGRPHGASRTEQAARGLANWPIQLRLVPPHAPFLQNAEVLLVADCVPFALADFHRRFMDGKPVLVACPKLDDAAAYVQKLAQILREANLRRLQVLHVDLPCCLGLRSIAEAAVGLAGVDLEVEPVVVTRQGECYEDATAARGIPARLAPAG